MGGETTKITTEGTIRRFRRLQKQKQKQHGLAVSLTKTTRPWLFLWLFLL
jgi:hypothetical protein